MSRRVEIIRALLNDPKVLLLDEPFRALDALTRSVMHEALLELYDLARRTIFFITHDLEEAIFLADRVVVMTTRSGAGQESRSPSTCPAPATIASSPPRATAS